MKKILLSSIFAIGAYAASAQTFSIQNHLTEVSTFGTPGIDTSDEAILMVNHVINTGTTPLTDVGWRIFEVNLQAGWHIDGFCDNISCRPRAVVDAHLATPGQIDTMFTIAVGDQALLEPRVFVPASSPNGVGTIKVRVTTATQTDTAVYVLTKNPLGVSTVALSDSRVSLFPNPGSNTLNIFINSDLKAQSVAIYNLLGAEVSAFKVTSEVSSNPTTGLAAGAYIVKVLGSNGEILATRNWTKL